MNSFSVGIKRSVFNYKLVNARKKLGLTQKEMADELGFTIPRYQFIETLKSYPTETEAKDIADYLGEDVVDMFPKWSFPVYGTKYLNRVVTMTKLQLESAKPLELAEPKEVEEKIDADLLKENLNKVLDTLSDRERKVLEMRFGLGSEEQKDLESVGTVFGVTRERIRQIEAKALRKLKHPSRKSSLESFI